MTGHTDGLQTGDLLREVAFVRRLARRLVRGPDDAEDLEQEVLLLAWKRRPERAGGVRPWLAAVARRLAFHRFRSDRRRGARERVAATPAAAADPGVVAQHFERVRAVVDEVHCLEEPYRTTLLRVYLEQQSPQEIAAALGLPAATVRGRLKRGLDLLRARLDARDPERPGRWREEALAWLGLTREPAVAPLLALAASVLLGVGIVAALVTRAGGPDAPAPRVASAEARGQDELAASAAMATRDIEPLLPRVAATSERAPELLRGRLLGVDRSHPFTAPIVAHLVDALAPTVAATLAPDGTFAVDLAPLHAPGEPLLACTIVADDPDYVVATETVLLDDGRGFGPFPELGGERRLRVVLAAAASGRVVDEAGRPLAHLDVLASRALGMRGSTAGVGTVTVCWSDLPGEAFTDDDGRFRIRTVAGGEQRLVVAARPGVGAPFDAAWRSRLPVERLVEFAPGQTVELGTLVSEAGRSVAGRVVGGDGAAVAGACVSAFDVADELDWENPRIAASIACSDRDGAFVLGGLADGRFRIEVDGLAERVEVASDACPRPLRLVLAQPKDAPTDRRVPAPAPVPEPGTVRLRLLDSNGERVARVHVALVPADRATPPRTCILPVSADGTAELPDVPAGTWRIDVRPGADRNGLHGLFLPQSGDVVVAANSVTELALPLRPGARLSLRIDDGEATARVFAEDGAPVDVGWFAASAPELLLPVEGPRADRDVVADRALAPGRYRLVLALDGEPPRERWVDLAPGATRLEAFERALR